MDSERVALSVLHGESSCSIPPFAGEFPAICPHCFQPPSYSFTGQLRTASRARESQPPPRRFRRKPKKSCSHRCGTYADAEASLLWQQGFMFCPAGAKGFLVYIDSFFLYALQKQRIAFLPCQAACCRVARHILQASVHHNHGFATGASATEIISAIEARTAENEARPLVLHTLYWQGSGTGGSVCRVNPAAVYVELVPLMTLSCCRGKPQ